VLPPAEMRSDDHDHAVRHQRCCTSRLYSEFFHAMSAWHLLRRLELAVVVGIKHAAQMGNLDAPLTRSEAARFHCDHEPSRAVGFELGCCTDP
jgi:hypothetical protein